MAKLTAAGTEVEVRFGQAGMQDIGETVSALNTGDAVEVWKRDKEAWAVMGPSAPVPCFVCNGPAERETFATSLEGMKVITCSIECGMRQSKAWAEARKMANPHLPADYIARFKAIAEQTTEAYAKLSAALDGVSKVFTDVNEIARHQAYAGDDAPPPIVVDYQMGYTPITEQDAAWLKAKLKADKARTQSKQTETSSRDDHKALEVLAERGTPDERWCARDILLGVERRRADEQRAAIANIRDEWDNLPDAQPEGIVRRP